MASHLTVTSAGSAASRGLSTQSAAETGGNVLGVFAELLGNTTSSTAGTSSSTQSSLDLGLGNLVDLSFGFGDGQDAEDPEAIAAAIDAALPIQANVEAKAAFVDLVDQLAGLRASLDAGEPLDPADLETLDTALDDLAAALDIDLSALPALDHLKALLAQAPNGEGITARLTQALAPLAETLLTGSTGETTGSADFGTLLKSIGDKLAALLRSLNAGGLDADKLAALGLDRSATIDADLEAALAKLTTPAPAEVPAPALASPELKLTEPTLTGKPTDAAAPSTAATEPVPAADAEPDTQSDTGDKPRGPNLALTGLAAAEAHADPQASQTAHQVSRIDAAAAPRVTQAGYQTSQQQLNLPQLAFELVRQVNDGNTRFQIRLDPPELGKIDVRLDIDQAGQVTARLTVEKAETLDLMQRDQRGLERALQQAGLDGAKTNLEFSLRQNPFSGGQQGREQHEPGLAFSDAPEEAEAPPPTVNLYRGSLTARGVNIIA